MVIHDLTVKKIFDKDGQKETTIRERIGGMPSFIGTLKYLYAYQNLYNYVAHASSCTPERLDEWYKEFGEFIYNLQGKSQQIWNGDEYLDFLCAPKHLKLLL